jgi:hypothetical protein
MIDVTQRGSWRLTLSRRVPCCVLAIAVCWSLGETVAPASAAPAAGIQLLASVTGSLKAGGPITFTLILANRSSRPVAVSPRIAGNIQIVAATRNGSPVQMTSQAIYSDIPLAAVIDRSSTIIKPSSRVVIRWSTRPEQGMQVLRTFDARRDPGSTTSYVLNEPGAYRITFVYQWGGSANVPRVYRPPSNAATVAFVLHP